MMDIPSEWIDEPFCYLTTTGRRTGRPHEIEIWFALDDGTFYLLSGGGRGSDWVLNLAAEPVVQLRVAERSFEARARVVPQGPEDTRARHLLAAKYQNWKEGEPLSTWAQTALAIAITPT
jgi:deazaflavin-dependent oxidoreductase (nitroreductase family)